MEWRQDWGTCAPISADHRCANTKTTLSPPYIRLQNMNSFDVVSLNYSHMVLLILKKIDCYQTTCRNASSNGVLSISYVESLAWTRWPFFLQIRLRFWCTCAFKDTNRHTSNGPTLNCVVKKHSIKEGEDNMYVWYVNGVSAGTLTDTRFTLYAYVHPATLKVNHKCGKIGQESCNQSCTHLSCISSRRVVFLSGARAWQALPTGSS